MLLLKSSVTSTVEEGGPVEGFGDGSWAATTGNRQDHAIRIGMISRNTTTHLRSPGRAVPGVLHVLIH